MHLLFKRGITTSIRCMRFAFHKIQWRNFSGVVNTFKIDVWKVPQDSMYQKSFKSADFWLSYSKNIKWTFLLWHSVETASDAKPLQTQHDAILTGRRRTGSTLLTCQLLSGTVYSFAPFRQNPIILSKFWSPVGSCATQVVLEYRPLNAWLFTYLFFCSFHAMHTHTV